MGSASLCQKSIRLILNISFSKGFSDQLATEATAKIFTFGSYRLGVHGTGADIDTLCVAPRYFIHLLNDSLLKSHIERSDFFGSLNEILSKNPEITELTVSNSKIIFL
jgi:poly(A) polymerase